MGMLSPAGVALSGGIWPTDGAEGPGLAAIPSGSPGWVSGSKLLAMVPPGPPGDGAGPAGKLGWVGGGGGGLREEGFLGGPTVGNNRKQRATELGFVLLLFLFY